MFCKEKIEILINCEELSLHLLNPIITLFEFTE